MFVVHTTDTGAVMPFEYLPAAAGTYKAGQLLKVVSGKLAAISAASTDAPAYLCMGEVAAVAGDLVPVTRISHDAIYETTLSAATASAAVGDKLEISAGGLEADGASAGAFELVYVDGTAKGEMVRGRFA